MFRRLTGLLALLALSACTAANREEHVGGMAEPVMEPAPVVEEPVMAEPAVPECAPGDDDGIGGTGCQID